MRLTLVLLALLCSGICTAQLDSKQENRLSYRSFSFSPIGIFNSKFGAGFSGAVVTADLTLQKNKHLFTFSASLASELNILGGSSSFSQYDLKYGRSFKLNSFIAIELHGGLGYFKFRDGSSNFFFSWSNAELQKIGIQNTSDIEQPRVTFPLVAKLLFRTGPRFSLGLQGSYSLNSLVNIYSFGIILQWNKRPD